MRADDLAICYRKKQTDVSFSCVCPVFDHEFPHNIVNYFDNVIKKLIVNNWTDAWNTDVNLFFKITNCRIVRSRSLPHRINYKFICLSVYWQWKLSNSPLSFVAAWHKLQIHVSVRLLTMTISQWALEISLTIAKFVVLFSSGVLWSNVLNVVSRFFDIRA